jgi:hypothetical protein
MIGRYPAADRVGAVDGRYPATDLYGECEADDCHRPARLTCPACDLEVCRAHAAHDSHQPT